MLLSNKPSVDNLDPPAPRCPVSSTASKTLHPASLNPPPTPQPIIEQAVQLPDGTEMPPLADGEYDAIVLGTVQFC
jgi:hypothetical protein